MRVFITGSAGFIGYHLAKLLLEEGYKVFGYDGMTPYYDVTLKQKRHSLLSEYSNFQATEALLEDSATLQLAVREAQPDVIIHLAAQAGVRYSLENPRAYIESNLVGTFNILEVARSIPVKHLLMASTSSVYGANQEMPFLESQKTDTPLTLYAATKKSNEVMSHAYSHLYHIPITLFRFFTVYGPWGRPDMALFKFTKGILEGKPIDIYNHGNMYRDFTYVDDLVRAIRLLIDKLPPQVRERNNWVAIDGDTLSSVAPWRVVNIGNSDKVRLLDFVEAIEAELGRSAIKNYLPIQAGDVPATWADCSLLKRLTGYQPQTPFRRGVAHFVSWYKEYYGIG